jgi:hypothetical protein
MSRLISVLIAVLIAAPTGCAPSRWPASERPRTRTAASSTSASTLPDTPPSDCSYVPLGGFKDVWRNEQVHPRLGCAVAPAEAVTGTELYLCDGTHTLWMSQKRLFVVIPIWPRPWRLVADESNLQGDVPLMEEPVPRSQACFPVSGRHGWLVRLLKPDGVNELWARTNETAFRGAIQQFEGGWLLWNGCVCFALFEDGTWTMF